MASSWGLTRVAHLDLAHEGDALVRQSFAPQDRAALGFHGREHAVDLVDVLLALLHDPGTRELVLQIRHQQAERRGGPGTGRHDEQPDLHLRAEAVGMQRSGASERHHDQVSRVVAALHESSPAAHSSSRHWRSRRCRWRRPRGRAAWARRSAGAIPSRAASTLSPISPPRKVRGVEPAEHQIGVRDGGAPRRPARSRFGPGSAPALCGPTRRMPPESTQAMLPAAGADLDQIDDRGPDGIAAGPPLGRPPGWPARRPRTPW